MASYFVHQLVYDSEAGKLLHRRALWNSFTVSSKAHSTKRYEFIK